LPFTERKFSHNVMFLVSILKLLVLFLVAMGIWHLLTRAGGNGGARRRAPRPGPFGGAFNRPGSNRFAGQADHQGSTGFGAAPPPHSASHAPTTGGEAVDLVKCGQCGAYIASSGARSCGRPDCPHPT
jgi:hypothetical protein